MDDNTDEINDGATQQQSTLEHQGASRRDGPVRPWYLLAASVVVYASAGAMLVLGLLALCISGVLGSTHAFSGSLWLLLGGMVVLILENGAVRSLNRFCATVIGIAALTACVCACPALMQLWSQGRAAETPLLPAVIVVGISGVVHIVWAMQHDPSGMDRDQA